MRTTTTGALIGGLSGGLLAYYLTRNQPWATIKKVAAVVGGAAGGGLVGYGIARIPEGGFARTAGMYPEFRSTDDVLRDLPRNPYPEGSPEVPAARRPRASRSTCTRPQDELRKGMLQWVELVKTPQAEVAKHTKIQSSMGAYEYLKDVAISPQENFYALLLNSQNSPVGHVLISRGSSTQTIVNPDDVFRPALLAGAVRIILTHNHPSGQLTPSPEDVKVTQRLSEAGRLLGVQVLDHLVISTTGFASMRDMGMIN